MGNSIYKLPFKMTTDELYSWAKQALRKEMMCKRVVNNGSPEDIVVLAVYRNWLSIQGGDTHCIQLGTLLTREEELYAQQNEKGQWKLVHPFFRYALQVPNTAKRVECSEQLELFAR